VVNQIYEVQALETSLTPQGCEHCSPVFAWASVDTIKHTLSVTTQYVRDKVPDNLQKYRKSFLPDCNAKRFNEAVNVDTVFSDALAIVTGGIKAAQLFIGRFLW
jgi:hypothetical protein